MEWVCHSKTQGGCWVPRPASASPRPQGVGGHWVTLGPPSCPTQAPRSVQQDTQIAFLPMAEVCPLWARLHGVTDCQAPRF